MRYLCYKHKTMKRLFSLLLIFSICQIWAQTVSEMTPQGFTPLTFKTPEKQPEKLIETSKTWAGYYNKDGYDVTDVTENSLTVTALKKTACYYYNLGVRYDFNVRYTMKIVFNSDKTFTVAFSANEFYAGEVLAKSTVPDFFTPDGKLKSDFRDVKPTLEATADRIIKSYVSFIAG